MNIYIKFDNIKDRNYVGNILGKTRNWQRHLDIIIKDNRTASPKAYFYLPDYAIANNYTHYIYNRKTNTLIPYSLTQGK